MVILMLNASVSAAGEAAPAAAPRRLSSVILEAVDDLGRFEDRLEFFIYGVEAICRENIDNIYDWGFMIEASSDLKRYLAEAKSLVDGAHEAAKLAETVR
ncbi:hypothetical protein ATO13_17214 [Stappia sp. 22II-S9-Z10]|nr:hypothetical protein ATO13_17214 [Stappia sp. 22II-S9-Z10]